jgi:DHA3 family macrolide efflux protein-like MFS transporter
MTTNSSEMPRSMSQFFILWSGQAVSLLGSQLVQFALIWWLTQETGSATILALASMVGLLPQVILGPIIGALVDRWNRRKILLVADSAVALASLVLAILFFSGTAQIWHVFVLMFVRSIGGGFHGPAMIASTSLMVPKQHLTRIQGLNQTLNGGLNILAAPLGAILLEYLPMEGILGIDVITASFAIAPLFFVLIPQPESSRGDGESPSTLIEDMKLGFSYMLGWPGLMAISIMAVLINMLLTPAFSLLPILITEHFGGDALYLGGMQSAMGVGVVLGGMVLGAWGGFKRRILTSITGLLMLGLAVLAIGVMPASLFAVATGAIFMVGFTLPIVNGPIMAVMQVTVAPEMQGRVFTLLQSMAGAMSPVGLAIAGPIADWIGVQTWYIAGGVVCFLMGLVGFFIPAISRVEKGRLVDSMADKP